MLVAVSGGQDSVVLAHLLHNLGYEISLAHVNFQLRGAASDEDARFVKQLSLDIDAVIHLHEANCSAYATEHKLSIQEAARDIRYTYFDRIKKEYGYQYILTAHHALDNVESVLYNLIKGTTLPSGIPHQRDDILRPLLPFSKADIDEYCSQYQIPYRTDASNAEDKYARNYIRHHVINHLKKINPSLEKTISTISTKADQYKSWIASMVSEDQKQIKQSGSINLHVHREAAHRGIWLYEVLRPYDMTWSEVQDIWSAYDHRQSNGQQFGRAESRFLLDRGALKLMSDQSVSDRKWMTIFSIESCASDTDGLLEMTLTNDADTSSREIALLDSATIIFPLTLRPWQDGDRFRPVGMHGQSKKVKKFLTDQKVPSSAKKDVMVLTNEDDIIWLVGHRVDHEYAASPEVSTVLKIRWMGMES